MKYNKKYNRYVTKNGLVYRLSKEEKLILCSQHYTSHNYLVVKANGENVRVHRLVWETFKGEIPDGYEIDHLDGNKENNDLDNLSCVTHKENMNNPNTLNKQKCSHNTKEFKERISESNTGRTPVNKGIPKSEFGIKFKEHYGITKSDDNKLYSKERRIYRETGKISWEE